MRQEHKVEISVLAALGAIATCLFAAIALLFAYNAAEKKGLFASAAVLPTPIAVSQPTRAGALPTPVPVYTATPKAMPRPTNTLVIPKESVNDRLIQDVEQKMVTLRNLPLLQAVPKRFLNQEDLRQQLGVWYKQDTPLEETVTRQQLYLALGFIRDSDD